MKLTTIAEKVKKRMETTPETRDNDNMLIALTWVRTLKEQGEYKEDMALREFFAIYAYESILPSAESIRRSRQKLQEIHPELRGVCYKCNQGVRQQETIDELEKIE